MQTHWAYVYKDDVENVWPSVSGLMDRGLKRGMGDSLGDTEIFDRLIEGTLEMWALIDGDDKVLGGMVLERAQRANGPVITVMMYAGEGSDEARDTGSELLREYADKIGAYTVEAFVRPGLVPRLKNSGWRRKAIVMELER